MKATTYRCPKCGHEIKTSDLAATLGSRGGRVKGASKARDVSKASKARWAGHTKKGPYQKKHDALSLSVPVAQPEIEFAPLEVVK